MVDFHGAYPARPGRSTLVESVKRSGVDQYQLQMRPKAYWEIANCCARRAGSITPIKAGPFRIGSREDRARRLCRTPAGLQGLTGIVIPSRKSQARHIGPLCSIRGKSGGGRSGGEPYRRVEQTTGQSTSRLELRVAVGFALFFSSPWYAYVWS